LKEACHIHSGLILTILPFALRIGAPDLQCSLWV
jgi:hypothetical protein